MSVNSIFAKLMLDLATQLRTQVTELRQVDQYLGQDQTDTRPAILSPAVLIDFETTEYEQAGDGSQFATATISLRLCLADFTTTSNSSSSTIQEKALEAYELERKVVNAVHLWAPSTGYCQPLVRTADQSENRNDIGLRIRAIAFTTSWQTEDEG